MTDTIPARLLSQARKRPHAPAYHIRDRGVWRATSWRDYSDEVRRAGQALIALGFHPGTNLCILGFNRPEWVIADLAAMAVGGAPAGIYTTSSPEECAYIIHHSGAPIVLVEDREQYERVAAMRSQLPELRHIVTMRSAPRIDDPLVLSWEQFLGKGAPVAEKDYLDRVEQLREDDLATLIYTSGTTGPPKGVMLSHRNLAWTASTAVDLVDFRAADCTLSYLPLSHIAEQMFSIHAPISAGGSVYFAESIDQVPENLKEVQPTIFFGVPRIWEKFHAGVSRKLTEAAGVKAKLLAWARQVSTEHMRLRQEGGEAGPLLKAQHALADRLVYSKLKPAIGLGRARVCVSGAAPIAPDVLEFFASLDILVLEVYGQSEDSGPTSFNLSHRFRFGTVGPAIPGVEVKIAEDDEILVRGPNVFLGYYKEPEATAGALQNGWLHSGDLGAFEDGFLKITGRKKEIIITAGGKNIAPKNIEAALKQHPLVSEAVVIGDRRKFLTALLTLDPEAAAAWASTHGVAVETLSSNEALRNELDEFIDDQVNRKLARVEQIKKFAVLPRSFGVDTGELTPTLKVKRRKVHESFAAEIEAMYAEP